MFRIIGDTNINFVGVRKISFVISTLLVILGIVAVVSIWTGKANMGIDFAGGVMVTGHFDQPVSIEDLRAVVGSEFSDAQITELKDFEQPNAFIIKTARPETESEGQEKFDLLNQIIAEKFAGNNFTHVSEHIIGPAVGETLRNDTQKAVLLSLAGILLYIWIRFDFRSGVAATLTTFHDVLAVLGIVFILGMEFNLLVVSALLTLAGYTLTNTVVVYDRVRENLKRHRSRGEFAATVNTSVNEVLARSINTSLTLFLVVAALYFLGGEVLRGFAFALIVGIVIGGFSSLFIASPLVVEWETRHPRRFK